MIIYTDSGGQIMAFYSHDTTSTAWAAYTRQEITDPTLVRQIQRFGRDAKFNGGVITPSPNPVQPAPKVDTPEQARFKELKGKLLSDTISDAEVRELLKLQYTPGVAAVPATRIP